MWTCSNLRLLAALLLCGVAGTALSQAPEEDPRLFEEDDEGLMAHRAPLAPGRELIYGFVDEGDLASADLLLADRWPVPRFLEVHLPPPLSWTENPYGEKYWRFIFYGLRPIRHLLWAFRTTGDTRYRDKLIAVLTSFAERGHESPYAWDKHTAAFRAMVLVNTYFKLKERSALPEGLDRLLLQRIIELGHFLRDPHNFEAGYNHGLAQAGALLLIAENFPSLPSAPDWHSTAVARLDGLLDRVLDEDGVEVEQSPFYHFYFLTGFWQIYHWALQHQIPLSPRAEQRIQQMLRYATHITLPNGSVPLLGASVARNVRKSADTPRYAEMAELDPAFAHVLQAGRAGHPPPETRVLFPSSGQAVLRSGFGTAQDFLRQTHVIFDVGPYRTAHSHLDALALHLYSAGRTLLPDSGLFTNEPGPEFDYFHGTRAHNTVVVDEQDQREGSAVAGLSTGGAAGGWAYQSGAHGLYEGVQHRRAVVLLRQDLVLVIDELSSDTVRTYDQTWHLFPQASLHMSGLRAMAADQGTGRLLLSIQQLLGSGASLSARKGSTAPIDGWYSERYEIKVPSYSLRYRKVGRTARFVTLLASGPLAAAPLWGFAKGTPENLRVTVCMPSGTSHLLALENLARPNERALVQEVPGCGDTR